MTSEAALALLEQERGSHFDPACLDAFFTAFARMRGPDVGLAVAAHEPRRDAAMQASTSASA
jgi:HD-GYP domain-containing protein (c-di-GMP phosphodiesterase class II)